MKKIAVIGAGSTGHAIAADLSILGYQINIYEKPCFKEKLEAIKGRGGIEIIKNGTRSFTKINMITTDIKKAINDVDIIIVSVLATKHEEYAKIVLPHIKDGQIIIISPGNAGSIVFWNKMYQMNIKKDITIGDIEGNLYACRLIEPATVFIGLPVTTKYVSAFPAIKTKKIIKNLSGIYNFLPAKNILETALNVPNITHHLIASLLNTGSIENSGGKYYLYRNGLTPSIIKCIKSIACEKNKVFNKLGYTDRYNIAFIEKAAKEDRYPELSEFRALIGPTSMRHRYIVEDAQIGVSLLVSLGKLLNVPTPISKAVLRIASVITDVDYIQEGRTLNSLGLSCMTPNQINKYLFYGKEGEILENN
jgi:opine dehydrogenase